MNEPTPGTHDCPHAPTCDPSDELVNPGDPYTTHTVCLVHDQDHPNEADGDPRLPWVRKVSSSTPG